MIIEGVVAEGFKLVLEEVFNILKSESSIFDKEQKKYNIKNAYLRASKIEEVKTIWQVDKTVNLNSFYYPSKILVGSKKVEINKLEDLPENGKMIIQGTAGQGKSIFLRYLTGYEIKFGKTLPIFIELRKITDKYSLEDLIIKSISSLGIECENSDLKHIYKSNKCTLLLDAFDEVKENQIQDTLSYIEYLCSKYHNLRVIISSRPSSEIQYVTFFKIYNLCPLEKSDFRPVLEKLFVNDQTVKIKNIIEAIERNGSEISSLLTTPLLLTLLTITYKSYHKIPKKLHEFYNNLFYLLVNRHDSTKPGFKREFKSNLNENKLEELFCAFCFYCTAESIDTITNNEAMSLVKKAKKITCIEDVSENNFLDDIKKNTCLIIQENFEYHFIHKSIKEYHAAKFISKSPKQLKEKFYKLALRKQWKYHQEIIYLTTIDTYYCSLLFLKPIYENLFSSFHYMNKTIHDKNIIFKDIYVEITQGKIERLNLSGTIYTENAFFNFDRFISRIYKTSKVKKAYFNTKKSKKLMDVTYKISQKEHIKYIESFLNSKFDEYEKILYFIDRQQKAIDMITF